jgi:ribosomal protein S18 acetylase RimI-like enzyme
MRLRPARRDQTGELLAFVRAHPVDPDWSVPLERLLGSLPTRDEAILDVEEGGERVAVAVLLDGLTNIDDVAMLELLGRRAELPMERLIDFLKPMALEAATQAGKTGVDLYLNDQGGAVPAGATAVRGALVMRRPDAELPVLRAPRGLRWKSLEESDLLAYHRLVLAAFADDPGMQVSPFDEFAQAVMKMPVRARLLCNLKGPVALARVSVNGEEGFIDSLGRHPDWRGRGLGPVVLGEAARLLRSLGAQHLKLGVTSSNRTARRLYEQYGFSTTESWTVWRWPISPVSRA